MVGRASLVVILGFSIIFGVAAQYWNRTSNRAIENFVNYYDSTCAHNIAVSVANLACDSIFQNNADTTVLKNGLSGSSFPGGGSYSINGQGINGNFLITATGTYAGFRGYNITDTVKALLSPFAFSRFAFFTNSDNGVYWTTGDTLTGPYQTNGTMYISGVPVIKGPASAFNGTNPAVLPDRNGDTLKADSFRSGVNVPLPTSISATAAAATKTYSNSSYTGSKYAYDVYLTFNSGGTVTETDTTRHTTNSGATWSVAGTPTSPTTVTLSSIASSQTGQAVILVQDGDVHVSGIVSGGSVTVVAQEPTSNNRISSTSTSNTYFNSSVDGNVLITGNLTYNNPATDMLGLVASNDVMLTTQSNGNPNNPSNSANPTIDAAIFALGSFTYEDYANNTNNGNFKGYLNIMGSLTQSTRGAVGTLSPTGYLKDYKYDSRFAYSAPPAFPGTNQYRVIAWRE